MSWIAYILLLLYTSLIIFYVIGWWRTKKYTTKVKNNNDDNYYYSIIIPARNESKNIIKCLNSIIQNNFPKNGYEIIVIDDFSEDDTPSLVHDFFKENNMGRLISLSDIVKNDNNITAHKKAAITYAIQISKGDYIIQTDADCIVCQNWLTTINQFITDHDAPSTIAAPVSLLPVKNKIIYWLQSIDFMTMQAITAATHFWGVGLMSNGANFIYKKSDFKAVNGFEDINKLPTGDDMLLLHKMAKAFPHSHYYLKSPSAIVHTNSQPTWNDFLHQRIRWSSKADAYNDKRLTLILLIVYLFNLSLLTIFIFGLFNSYYLFLTGGILIVKILIEYILLIPSVIFFNKTKQLLVFPILQPLHIVYIIFAGFLGMFSSYKWKNRVIKK